MAETGRLRNLYDELTTGGLSRRAFVERTMALGVGAPVALFLARTGGVSAQDATPVPAVGKGSAPSSGTEGQTRGAGGELKLLQWQAPTTLNMQLAGSFKDQLASCLVTEPLIHFLPDGTPIPFLVKEVPSQENGLVSADLKTVTYNLLDGIVW